VRLPPEIEAKAAYLAKMLSRELTDAIEQMTIVIGPKATAEALHMLAEALEEMPEP
jgi:hypothetical protein